MNFNMNSKNIKESEQNVSFKEWEKYIGRRLDNDFDNNLFSDQPTISLHVFDFPESNSFASHYTQEFS